MSAGALERDEVGVRREWGDRGGGRAIRALNVAIAAPRRILIFKPCCIGDVLMATPLAAALKAEWPDAEIEWAVAEHARPALEGNPHLAGLIDASGCFRGSLRARDVVRLVIAIRRKRYDAAFIPDRSPVSALIPMLAGVRVRVGLDGGSGRGWAHTVRVPTSPVDPRPEREIYLALARAVGVDANPTGGRPVFVPSEGDRAAAVGVLGAPTDDRPVVVIHPAGGENPGMTLREKRWPVERFGELARWIVERGWRVVLVGGPADREIGAAIVRAALGDAGDLGDRRILDHTGRLSLGGTAAVIETCDAFVGNDSGIAHLAAAVGTSVVVIFGPTDATRYGPAPGAGVAVTAGSEELAGGADTVIGAGSGLGGGSGRGTGSDSGGGSGTGSGSAPTLEGGSLRALAGSTAIHNVTVEAVWSALQAILDGGDVGGGQVGL